MTNSKKCVSLFLIIPQGVDQNKKELLKDSHPSAARPSSTYFIRPATFRPLFTEGLALSEINYPTF
jgi:hypothetical protein